MNDSFVDMRECMAEFAWSNSGLVNLLFLFLLSRGWVRTSRGVRRGRIVGCFVDCKNWTEKTDVGC